MANGFEVSEAWLSRYLDLASLPQEVVRAFGDVTQIRVKHGRDLKPYLKDRKARARIIEGARALRSAGKEVDAGAKLDGAQVVRELLAVAATKPARRAGLRWRPTERRGKGHGDGRRSGQGRARAAGRARQRREQRGIARGLPRSDRRVS